LSFFALYPEKAQSYGKISAYPIVRLGRYIKSTQITQTPQIFANFRK